MRASLDKLSSTFVEFVESERAGGALLFACTLISLGLANSSVSAEYLHLWDSRIGGLSLHAWINDALMAVFFLLVGLELQREFQSGELSDRRRALLPAVAALGGMLVPAGIHFALNANGPTVAGAGIPMATDIAFAMAVLALLGPRIPAALKVFVVAFAVMDDLGAIVVIAAFYSTDVSALYLAGAVLLWLALWLMNRRLRVMSIWPYALGGVALWWLVLQSGIHATLAGVALAFAIPHSHVDGDRSSPAHVLEHALQKPVAWVVLPLFALANTGIPIAAGWMDALTGPNSMGIMLGLVIGKPVGIALFALGGVALGLCALPTGVTWAQMIGAGILGGIGFTMSIFITNLAFADGLAIARESTLAVLVASAVAGLVGFAWLRFLGRAQSP